MYNNVIFQYILFFRSKYDRLCTHIICTRMRLSLDETHTRISL